MEKTTGLRFVVNGKSLVAEEHELVEHGLALEYPVTIRDEDGDVVATSCESATTAMQVEWWAESGHEDLTWLTFTGEGPGSTIRFRCRSIGILYFQDLVGLEVHLPTLLCGLLVNVHIKDCMGRSLMYQLDPTTLEDWDKRALRSLLHHLRYYRKDVWTWTADY